jgi:hypothetical protein
MNEADLGEAPRGARAVNVRALESMRAEGQP